MFCLKVVGDVQRAEGMKNRFAVLTTLHPYSFFWFVFVKHHTVMEPANTLCGLQSSRLVLCPAEVLSSTLSLFRCRSLIPV